MRIDSLLLIFDALNFHIVVPRFLLTRPKGGHNLELVTLDTIINYDPMEPTQLIDKLLGNNKTAH